MLMLDSEACSAFAQVQASSVVCSGVLRPLVRFDHPSVVCSGSAQLLTLMLEGGFANCFKWLRVQPVLGLLRFSASILSTSC